MEKEQIMSASEAAIARDIEAFEAELGRRVADPNPAINPNQERIPGTKEDPFPKVRGRRRIPTPLEVATTINEMGVKVIDRATLRSVSDMD